MFLCHPLLEVLAGRGIEDIDAFLQTPSWSDLPDPFSISSMEPVVDRILAAVGRKERIAVFGDYDCDGVLGAHILRGVSKSLGAEARVYLPHRDEGYGLNAPAVHQFSLSGTDLLITVDNGINARAAVRLAQRLGIEVIVIDHHRVQDRAETLSVWSDRFCGTGLAAMVAWALTQRAGWKDSGVERLIERASQYAAIASIADCVPLLGSTRTLARLGLASLGKSNHCGVRELLKTCCKDPLRPSSHEIAFGIAPRINAAGRVAHPAAALAVLDAGADEVAAEKSVQRLNELNVERRPAGRAALQTTGSGDGEDESGRFGRLSGNQSKRHRGSPGEPMRRAIWRSQHCADAGDGSWLGGWFRENCLWNRFDRGTTAIWPSVFPLRGACASNRPYHADREHQRISGRFYARA